MLRNEYFVRNNIMTLITSRWYMKGIRVKMKHTYFNII